MGEFCCITLSKFFYSSQSPIYFTTHSLKNAAPKFTINRNLILYFFLLFIQKKYPGFGCFLKLNINFIHASKSIAVSF